MSFKNNFQKVYKYILPIGFSIIILMMIVTNLFAMSQMTKYSKSLISTTKQQTTNHQLLGKLKHVSFDRSMILGEMLQTEDPFRNDELFLELNVLFTAFTTNRAKFESQDMDDHMQELLDEQGRLSRKLGPLQIKVYELLQLGEKNKAVLLFNEETLKQQQDVHEIINTMTEHEYADAKETFKKLEEDNNHILSSVLLFNLISIFFSILLTIFLLRQQKNSNTKLATLATTDSLTSLPNREKFIDIVDTVIKTTPESVFAIVFFDIDKTFAIGHTMYDSITGAYFCESQILNGLMGTPSTSNYVMV